MSARAIVSRTIDRGWAKAIWTGNYDKALPISIQEFSLGAVLPAVFYMFRFGRRRGAGRFADAFSPEHETGSRRKNTVTIDDVAARLARSENFAGFDGNVGRAILGDLLLSFCLENIRSELGHGKQVQRVAPAHYMSSWIDLPERVSDLRLVPEMIVSTLAGQEGDVVALSDPADRDTRFAVGRGHETNVLLGAFRQGMEDPERLGDFATDTFNENDESVGVDQLLIIRVAQEIRAAPARMRGGLRADISNQKPIARRASEEFSEDLRKFVRSYASLIPRLAFLEMLEACMALGLATIFTSTVEILTEWERTGAIPQRREQHPAGIFVDCSNSIDRWLRACSERSMDDTMRRIDFFPTILMILRLLDRAAMTDRELKNQRMTTRPYATEWIDFLGELYMSSPAQPRASNIHGRVDEWAFSLAESLSEEFPDVAQMLKDDRSEPNSIRRMAETLVTLMGRRMTQSNTNDLLDSVLLIDRPNGLARKRTSSRKEVGTTTPRRRTVRSIVFTDPVLDYLVHIRILKSGSKRGAKPLSLRQFLRDIRQRYGLYVDVAPPNTSVSHDLLRANRTILERRLRDLGLLTGVNDAEEMKRLRPRFRPEGSE